MGQLINLHAERWIEGVFNEEGLRVDVSTKGNVRFIQSIPDEADAIAVLSMEQIAKLGEALSVAYKEE